jgi:hypothetical protein
MGWINQNRRWAAVGVAAGLVVWGWIAFGGPLLPSPAKDRAAWAQVYSSAFAILASGGLAIWVPIHMRHLEEKAVVQRAINCLVVGVGLTHSAWDSVQQVVDARDFHDKTPRMIEENVASARAALGQIPYSVMLGTTLMVMSRCTLALQTLQIGAETWLKAPDPSAAAARFPYKTMLDQIEDAMVLVEHTRPARIDGTWMIYSPEDDLSDEVIEF